MSAYARSRTRPNLAKSCACPTEAGTVSSKRLLVELNPRHEIKVPGRSGSIGVAVLIDAQKVGKSAKSIALTPQYIVRAHLGGSPVKQLDDTEKISMAPAQG